MKSFRHIADLIKKKRLAHPSKYSQNELSVLLGYKNGQFISNVERGLCSIPLKKAKDIADLLEIPKEELRTAILKDCEATLSHYYSEPSPVRPNPETRVA